MVWDFVFLFFFLFVLTSPVITVPFYIRPARMVCMQRHETSKLYLKIENDVSYGLVRLELHCCERVSLWMTSNSIIVSWDLLAAFAQSLCIGWK